MKIQLLTPGQHEALLSAYNNYPELFLQNDGYEYIGRNTISEPAKQELKKVESVLKDVICGFYEFSNFCHSKDGQIRLRIQYNWNYDQDCASFSGVGYVLLTELLNGFNEFSS